MCVVDGLFFGQIYWGNGMGERRERRGQSENENLIMSELKKCHDIVCFRNGIFAKNEMFLARLKWL